jgi:glycosyltransferase involved in cell wall biosynthesis
MPNVVLEAMSLGIPVIITPQTNMLRIVKKSDCGWIISHSKNQIKNFFLELENIKRSVFKKKGMNGFNFIHKQLNWDVIVKKSFLTNEIKSYKP